MVACSQNGEVYVSISSSTKREKEAADDLKYLRGLPTAPRGATIHGNVFRTAPENPASKAMVLFAHHGYFGRGDFQAHQFVICVEEKIDFEVAGGDAEAFIGFSIGRG